MLIRRTEEAAEIIHSVLEITPELEQLASGAGSSFSTGGMITKISAAKICLKDGIDCLITSGSDPAILFDVLAGKEVGTHFVAQQGKTQHIMHDLKEKLTLYGQSGKTGFP